MSGRKYSPEETARLRAKLLENIFEPAVRSAFRDHPEFHSATLLVAQYWNDEAEDAVHYRLVFSPRENPLPLVSVAGQESAALRERRPWYHRLARLGEVTVNPATTTMAAVEALWRESAAARRTVDAVPAEDDDFPTLSYEPKGIRWSSNGEPIALFAAFCSEDCHQGMPPWESLSPYAIFRRRQQAIDLEIIGVMHRPWLDGVRPQTER